MTSQSSGDGALGLRGLEWTLALALTLALVLRRGGGVVGSHSSTSGRSSLHMRSHSSGDGAGASLGLRGLELTLGLALALALALALGLALGLALALALAFARGGDVVRSTARPHSLPALALTLVLVFALGLLLLLRLRLPFAGGTCGDGVTCFDSWLISPSDIRRNNLRALTTSDTNMSSSSPSRYLMCHNFLPESFSTSVNCTSPKWILSPKSLATHIDLHTSSHVSRSGGIVTFGHSSVSSSSNICRNNLRARAISYAHKSSSSPSWYLTCHSFFSESFSTSVNSTSPKWISAPKSLATHIDTCTSSLVITVGLAGGGGSSGDWSGGGL